MAENVVLYAAGRVAVLFNTETLERTYLPSLDGGGIGCCTVHPSGKYFAVGEKSQYRSPNIYIYEYPSLSLHRVLEGGTEVGYADMDFCKSGDKLASVGGKPDYMLTVWNWDAELTMLRSKAFAQDVHRVCFSIFDDARLITGGTGHIKFWKMASTFTGLKLKGELGKFGNVELSDTCAFEEFPDGKRVCGTELGQLLVWDGNLIKVEFRRSEEQYCHDGMIEILRLIWDKKLFLTSGHDGFIRFWDFDTLDQTDPPEDGEPIVFIQPVREINLGPSVVTCGFHYDEPNCLVQDMTGQILELSLKTEKSKSFCSYISGPILGLDVSPCAHLAATTGQDCTVRLWDYVNNTSQLCIRENNSPGTCVRWVPLGVDPSGCTVTVGFNDGMLRIFTIGEDGSDCTLSKVCKPHDSAVREIEFSPDNCTLATTGDDCNVFFLSLIHISEPTRLLSISYAVFCLKKKKKKKK
eukprot:TRINITY_DN16591_c0_g1_i4.p1 TRINITY_DN16591_c0_g1~~TRINITY_DN16591_c0_g1_i4.p1  ORF type:complete len:466 (-),score=121.61 TRINITY_DN16591_c0_g1_i4:96-1493(-)